MQPSSLLLIAAFACSVSACGGSTDAECDDCPIVLTEIAAIGGADEEGGVSSESIIALGPKGFYAAPSYDGAAVPVYGVDGSRTGTLGREGSAPGEFRGPLLSVMGDGSSVDVIDLMGSRWTKFGPDHNVVSTVQVPFPSLGTWYAALADGRIAVAGVTRPGPGNNKPLHIVSPDGAILSFAPPDPADSTAFHFLAPARDGGLWTIQTGAYKVMKWSAAGVLERTFSLERPWFVSTPRNERPTTSSILNDRGSHGYSLRERPDGLWVVLGRVRKDWKPPSDVQRLGDGSEDIAGASADKYEGVIEVLDPVTGAVRATGVFPHKVRFINDTLAYASSLNEDGVAIQKIYRVGLNLQ